MTVSTERQGGVSLSKSVQSRHTTNSRLAPGQRNPDLGELLWIQRLIARRRSTSLWLLGVVPLAWPGRRHP